MSFASPGMSERMRSGFRSRELGGSVRLFLAALFLILSGIAALCVDCPVALWFSQGHAPIVLHQLSNLTEFLGRPEFVFIAGVVIFFADRRHRWAVPVVIGLALASGLSADIIKLLVARIRPHHFDLAGSVWATFSGWLPLTTAGSGGQSFPSGHTATAAGLAFGIGLAFSERPWGIFSAADCGCLSTGRFRRTLFERRPLRRCGGVRGGCARHAGRHVPPRDDRIGHGTHSRFFLPFGSGAAYRGRFSYAMNRWAIIKCPWGRSHRTCE